MEVVRRPGKPKPKLKCVDKAKLMIRHLRENMKLQKIGSNVAHFNRGTLLA